MGNVYMLPSMVPPMVTAPKQDNKEVNNVDVKELDFGKPTEEYDLFRDSLIRYLGYTNEVGEAFRRHISHKLYIASYAVAVAYVCSDTLHKAHRSISRGEGTSKALINAGDAFVWQMFASVIVPGFVINRITYLTRRLVRLKRKKCICKASSFVRYSPVAVGLLAIPFVVHPIDNSITWIMDRTLRLLYRNPESGGTGQDSKRDN